MLVAECYKQALPAGIRAVVSKVDSLFENFPKTSDKAGARANSPSFYSEQVIS